MGSGGPAGRWLLPLVALAAACDAPATRLRPGGATGTPPPHNNASPAAPIQIGEDDALGWLGVVPAARAGVADAWLPVHERAAVLVAAPAEGLTAGAHHSMVRDRLATVTVGGVEQIEYGCDGNRLELVVLTGERQSPGVAWVLPAGSRWAPAALPIATATTRADRRRHAIGPLLLELDRRDARRGELVVRRDGRALLTLPFERSDMAGADPAPLDLAGHGPGVPWPAGAWSLGPGGPAVIAIHTAGFEGTNLWAILVDADRGRVVPALASYLYHCAF